MAEALFLESTPFASFSCKVHPVVIWGILDHYSRRPDNQSKVIGTLMGINFDGQIEIRNSFPVPHKDEGPDSVAVDGDFYKNMYELHHKAHPKEVIVGWYSTGSEITDHTVLIHHDFYANETQLPIVHLTVETDLRKAGLGMKAYVSSAIGLEPEKPLAVQFLPIALELATFEAERVTVDALMRGRSAESESISPLASDLANLETSISKLLEMLGDTSSYVDKVLTGKAPANTKIGRFLADTVSALPKVDHGAFEKMFHDSLQDLLMAVYLANLTRTQLALAEKLERIEMP